LQPQIGTMVLANGGIGLIDSDANGLMVRPVGPWECYSNRLHYTSSDWINDYKTQYLPTRTGNLFTC
jgi:hypothetical protein